MEQKDRILKSIVQSGENKENEVTVMNAWCDQDVDENSDDAYFKITLMFPDPCPEVTV